MHADRQLDNDFFLNEGVPFVKSFTYKEINKAFDQSIRFLVFDYMENGRLKDYLHAWSTFSIFELKFLTDTSEQRNRRLVFQFGMLLLELITGQSLLYEAEIVHQIQESEFAYSIHKIVDTDPGDHYDSKELGSLLVMARLCTKAENDTSISIRQILRFLQGQTEHSAL
ncbi:hypothetical protein ZIOFF_041177 [Zingiber officinale]|uniref:non-specific serine/threonine protein kinase n=1 Tax=Zingiber officinale TaxID=94328 RepID=A0A8J5GGX0_ZINOF|nr:hypothetical protein ZIOFF_041177 [Zingiber officinale]